MSSVPVVEAPARRQRRRLAPLRDFAASPAALIGLVLVALVLFGGLLAPLLSPQDPYDLAQLDIMDSRLPPGSLAANGMVYWLGTDSLGRDMLSAMLYGLRISLLVGFGSALIASIIGAALGILAAYAGGKTDSLVMRLVDLHLAFPSILIALMIVALLGKGVINVMVALIVIEWAYSARAARSAALVERRREYIEAAEGLALPRRRILFRHLLPNCLPPLIIIGTMQAARAITLEATLSFLGLGVPVTQPSLGLLIANGYPYLMSGDYWISIYPGIALFMTVVGINLLMDRLREILNPRTDA
jgi:peptide/nickel transport system permease protein